MKKRYVTMEEQQAPKKRFVTMKERPESERPYEKCQETGPETLTDGELLAVILRTGIQNKSVLEICWEVLDAHPTCKGLAGLSHLDREMLERIPGVGRVKATQILCIAELSRRIARASVKGDGTFTSPDYIAAYYMEHMRHLEKERVMLLLLDSRHRLIREIILSEGTENTAFVPLKPIFQEALTWKASKFVLIHNHPSGNPEPSREDLLTTRRVKEAGEMVDLPLLDHIIIGDRCYTSLKEQGLL